MEYRLFGRTGVRVAPLAIGTMNFGAPTSEEESARILARALDAGLNLFDWSPLAQDVLAGRYDDATTVPASSRAALRGGIYAERVTQAAIAVGQRFVALAKERDIDPAQLALAWVMGQPGITAPLFGPRTLAQLEQALPAVELRLDDALRQLCDALVPPGSAVVNFHNTAGWMRQQLAW